MISMYSVRYILVTGNTCIKKVAKVHASSEIFAFEKIKKELKRRFSHPTKIEVYTDIIKGRGCIIRFPFDLIYIYYTLKFIFAN
ncbi:TPA: hypothetical protein QCY71_005749 [Bacillus cereus]|nr:hypothetical protein [Bacillus cereus]